MPDTSQPSLEDALSETEADAQSALKAASAVMGALKRFRAAAQTGNLREFRPTLAAAEQALLGLQERIGAARAGWTFDEQAYFEGGAFQRELLDRARQAGLQVFQQDEQLFSYPSLIRVLPDERTVLIDRARERRVRPSVLVNLLRDLQRRPARFKPEAFLESLHAAYERIEAARTKERGKGKVVRLLDVYALLTLLPGASKEYTRQEFARDVYLLDKSGVTSTRGGPVISFPASTGAKSTSGTLRVITERGEEKTYFGIAFQAADDPSLWS
jgi:hypothetical protein